MTKAERERHFAAGHLPYDPRCEICTSCKRPNVPHLKSHDSERTIPLLVGGYGFVKDGSDDENITILVLKLFPYRLIFACVVPSKGSDPLVVARLCRFIMECGLLNCAYRSDRELAIVSLIQDACAMAGRNGVKVHAVEDAGAWKKVGAVSGVPLDFKTKDFDIIEEDVAPHAHPEASEEQEVDESSIRRLRITMEHLREHGHIPNCRRCNLHRQGLHARAKHLRHDEACRSQNYQNIKAAKSQVGEEEDKRLESKVKSSNQVNEPKPDAPVEVPVTPKDESMEAAPAEDLEPSADAGDIGGRDLHMADEGDTTEFFREVDGADDAFVGEPDPVDDDSCDHGMIALMDILQTLGVGPKEANRYRAKIMMTSSQPLNTTFVDMYGCENIFDAANHVLRNLNVYGLCAFGLSTAKPSGEAWDFSRTSARKMALQYVQERNLLGSSVDSLARRLIYCKGSSSPRCIQRGLSESSKGLSGTWTSLSRCINFNWLTIGIFCPSTRWEQRAGTICTGCDC